MSTVAVIRTMLCGYYHVNYGTIMYKVRTYVLLYNILVHVLESIIRYNWYEILIYEGKHCSKFVDQKYFSEFLAKK